MLNLIKNIKYFICSIGLHRWVYKSERVAVNVPDNQFKTFNITRRFRVCRNCYKTQHSAVGVLSKFGYKWIDEDVDGMKSRGDLIRRIKINKIKNNIK